MSSVIFEFPDNPSDQGKDAISYCIDHPKAKNHAIPTHQDHVIHQKDEPHEPSIRASSSWLRPSSSRLCLIFFPNSFMGSPPRRHYIMGRKYFLLFRKFLLTSFLRRCILCTGGHTTMMLEEFEAHPGGYEGRKR